MVSDMALAVAVGDVERPTPSRVLMLAIPFVVVVLLALVWVPWARRARARGSRGFARWAPMLAFAVVIVALCVWMFTVA